MGRKLAHVSNPISLLQIVSCQKFSNVSLVVPKGEASLLLLVCFVSRKGVCDENVFSCAGGLEQVPVLAQRLCLCSNCWKGEAPHALGLIGGNFVQCGQR